MERYLEAALRQDIQSKIVLLTGPRQSGKTTLARMLVDDHQYFNHDLARHRVLLAQMAWDRERPLIVFDELHKMAGWKSWLKGIYDVDGIPPALLVTGSANLSAFRKTGDSLAGRYFQFRLHPVDVKEAVAHAGMDAAEALTRLLAVGGFPEPFLKGTERHYQRWRRTHIDVILREDLQTLTAVRDIQSIETLIELLRDRVGSPVSVRSLARDLQKSPNTVQNWLGILENLYVVFRVAPYHRNVARALLKAPKYYFHDVGLVRGGIGARFECLVACALLKEIHRREDVEGEDLALRYIRDKEGREVDFLVTAGGAPRHLIETKWGDGDLSPHLGRFLAEAPIRRTQVVGELDEARSFPTGERVEPAAHFLARMDL